jgi:peroxiredoxin
MQLSSVVGGVVLAAALAACASAGRSSIPVEPLAFELPDARSTRPVNLSDYRGHVVLVDVWATWCKPCEESMAFYTDLYRRYEARGFTVLAVSVDQHDEDLARFLETHALPFPVLRDKSGTLPAQLDLQVMPTAFLLDRTGRIVDVHPGFIDSDRSVIEGRVRQAVERGGSKS